MKELTKAVVFMEGEQRTTKLITNDGFNWTTCAILIIIFSFFVVDEIKKVSLDPFDPITVGGISTKTYSQGATIS